MEQKQKQGTPGADAGRGPLEQGGDDRLRDLANQAKKLETKIEETQASNVDPRRSMDIEVQFGVTRSLLYINGTLWAEVDWHKESTTEGKYCIQDCLGYCLNHVEHVVKEIPLGGVIDSKNVSDGMRKAIEVAKQMIRDGSMRSPEEARQFAIANNTSAKDFRRD